MAGSAFGRWPLLLGAALVLAACQETDRSGRVVGAGPAIAPAGATRAAAGDVEAPDVFEKTENGLWDGRPSLGGIWVAHPDVSSPERVLIQNQANGKTIVGALFRRERANPGPRIQISSDAATELGILAGQPTMLRVVALKRREEAAPEPAPAPAPEPAAAPAPAPAGTTPAAPAPAAEDAAAIAADTGAALATTAEAAGPQPVPEDRPPTSFGRRRDRQ
ncbi:MAG: SPOR domain-containing protein, partial [Rhodobacteraceae bacterium]|nr:SPOR domain-containing protein [Paracoccaceae bacterium]